MSNSNQPIYILPEGYQRTMGRDAQRNNILAGKIVAETVRTTLGPKGMDKMIVDSLGDVIVTNDGVTILEEMQIEHPAAKMIVEVAKTQENEVGDGTTTAVVLAGELLKNAEVLLDKDIHPTVIAKGYRIAAEESQKILKGMAENVSPKDDKILVNIAITAMTGKGAEANKELLADLTVKAVKQVMDEVDGVIDIDMDNIKLEKKVGGGTEDSELIQGIVLDKERVHSGMPKFVTNGKVALIDSALEIKNTETDAKIQITDPSQMQMFIDQEENMLKNMVDLVVKSGANVVFCQKGIDDIAQHYLAKAGIFACRRVKQSDMQKLARATGARIVTNLKDLSSSDLGKAGTVIEKKIGDEGMTYVQDCKNPKAVTLLVRGGTEHVTDEIERAVKDALGDVSAALTVGKVVAGGGAPEVELAKKLREFSNKLSGREQLAVMAFAEAMEVIPRTLAENAGLDPIDMLTDLKARHDKGDKWAGLDVFKGKVIDCWKAGVIEPLKIKTQAIKSSAEVTELILRIDDIIAGSGSKSESSGMPPGMGGMM
ncbi:MAG: TCP-1/cpn60 chaperonin family protein [Nanoarchaeota archaeon]|nr:TCP-1/cpn60 chaperonin family protein [Nanoarchaeota archaeon]MBU1445447.1 TCP-1/cpn60 chaperonin family protein [Nanoarchaeota archaeon]MBU2406977.1 TCP-1/cpn60 chaperonin family protein [Nanoarchaeota archaeon]MBU2420255.1 TCP-1/cpn60 chaperonin family protein [Nanoarchaeota archaeon]MBU2474982.1 TCP-1/cpn60 chaperonin family protein [Nanoarchaeota archaeon]